MLLNFRRAGAKDIAIIYEIELLSFKDSYSLDFLLDMYMSPFYEMFVAEESSKEKIVGYAITALDIRERKATHLVSFAVHPEFSRRKIGTRFLEFLLKNYKENGARLFWLEVRESNKPAIEFYKKNGFSEIGRAKGYYRYEDALIFTRHL